MIIKSMILSKNTEIFEIEEYLKSLSPRGIFETYILENGDVLLSYYKKEIPCKTGMLMECDL